MGNATTNTGNAGFHVVGVRQIIRALAVFAVAYGLLMAAWPVWGAAYVKLYSAAAAGLFGSPGRQALVRFSPSTETIDEVKVTFYDRRRRDGYGRLVPLMRIAHDVRYGDYIYTAFVTALVLATPIPWKRKGWALVGALALMHVFMAFRLGILILYLLSSERVALLALNRFWSSALSLGMQVFTINILPGFVVGILIWFLVSFRRRDWPQFLMPAATPARTERAHRQARPAS